MFPFDDVIMDNLQFTPYSKPSNESIIYWEVILQNISKKRAIWSQYNVQTKNVKCESAIYRKHLYVSKSMA